MILTTQTQISSSGPAAVLPPAPFPRPFGCLPVFSLDILPASCLGHNAITPVHLLATCSDPGRPLSFSLMSLFSLLSFHYVQLYK